MVTCRSSDPQNLPWRSLGRFQPYRRLAMTDEVRIRELLSDDNGNFDAIRVAERLAANIDALQANVPVSGPDLSQAEATKPLSEETAVAIARGAIRLAWEDPELRPLLSDAIRDQDASKEQFGTGILEAGIALTLLVFVAKLRIH